MPYSGKCGECKFYDPHKLDQIATGYGTCTKHATIQLKTEDDAAIISDMPIVWKDCNCSLGEIEE